MSKETQEPRKKLTRWTSGTVRKSKGTLWIYKGRVRAEWPDVIVIGRNAMDAWHLCQANGIWVTHNALLAWQRRRGATRRGVWMIEKESQKWVEKN